MTLLDLTLFAQPHFAILDLSQYTVSKKWAYTVSILAKSWKSSGAEECGINVMTTPHFIKMGWVYLIEPLGPSHVLKRACYRYSNSSTV